jgi:dihydroxyacetone kinase-like protein
MNELRKSRRLSPDYQIKITRATVREWMVGFAANIRQAEEELTELDRAIGDGDHGVNMRRGMETVVRMLEPLTPADLAGQLRAISAALTSSVGGASGPLYGAFFLHSSHLALHKLEFTLSDLCLAIEAGHHGVMHLGKAVVGDKTMVDALAATVYSLRNSAARHESIPEALQSCASATRNAAMGTIPMVARKGRASYLGERSAGFQDPGARSVTLMIKSLAQVLPPISPLLPPHPLNQPQTVTLP